MSITRRDFLKFSTLLTASALFQPSLQLFPSRLSSDPIAKNILIIVFDAFSAHNINFYGYPRETMPHLTKLLGRATVYHNHYASSNFTTPGTASLLTGRHAWDHFALKLTDTVRGDLANKSIFSYFDDYYKLAYTHNYYADILLTQFHESITHHEFYKSLFLRSQQIDSLPWFDKIMDDDLDTASLFRTLLSDTSLNGLLYSLLFPSLLGEDSYDPPAEVAAQFPRGIPVARRKDPFILEDAIDWTMQQSTSIPQPFLGYIHFFPPHDPYNCREDFVDVFKDDDYNPPEKTPDPFALRDKVLTHQEELEYRQHYDEHILYVDSEFNRLFSYLDQQGILENTLVVLTSDHGEIIDRAVKGHNLPYLFEPLVKVPLIIFEPGQAQRQDIHTITSCIDLLPTLLHYTDHQISSELPGEILPPFSEKEANTSRPVYALHARKTDPENFQIQKSSLSFRRDNMKIIRYSGYSELNNFIKHAEKLNLDQGYHDPYYLVFDLDTDPEELNDLARQPTPEIQVLIDEIEHFFKENVEYTL